ncbi:MAG TPA: plastocyanin/azurin family copper-binding protein [Acidimicrobiales bacterium]
MRRIAMITALILLSASCSTGSSDVPKVGPAASSAAGAIESIFPDLTPKADLEQADEGEEHVAYAPSVPARSDRSDQRIFDVRLEVLEGVCPLDPANSIDTEMWGFRIAGDADVVCGSPGPVLRGRVGDVARITLTNLEGNSHPHNIDFHAVTGQGGGAADLTVAPGETAAVEVRLLYPGAFMYHCAFGDVPMHIAKGMVGMFIVDPSEPLGPVDHEWAVMQSEWYVGEAVDGLAPFDPDSLRLEHPRYVTFNGRTDALAGDNALEMAVGERARIYMVNEGLNLDSNFHPIGSHWDVVYPEAATHPSNRVIRGSQTTLVVAGGGTVTEIVGVVPSTILLVDHALVRTFYKGAIGQIVITGDEDPEIFEVADVTDDPGADDDTTDDDTTDDAVIATEAAVSITEGAWNPDNAANAFSPASVRVASGSTVTWTNDDTLGHTVTSGTSDGATGTPDGRFDSGNLNGGDDFEVTLDEPGTYTYYCTPHPWMRGVIEVVAP